MIWFTSLGSSAIPYDAHLYLIGGQSNVGTNPATGRVAYSLIPSYLAPNMPDVKYWNEVDDFTTSYTQPNDQWGWSIEFWYSKSQEVETNVVKYGKGGVQLAAGDSPHESFNRTIFKTYCLDALTKLQETKNNINIVMLWNQGYTDGLDETNSLAYDANLTAWFAEIRSHLSLPNMPIIYNRLHTDASSTYKANVRTGQENNNGGLNVMFDSDSFELQVDGAHYSEVGAVELGQAFYIRT